MTVNVQPTENEVQIVIVHDLRQWAAETGRPLPYPPHHVAQLEMADAVVDLETGAITWPQEEATK